jgi:hypothetical protein
MQTNGMRPITNLSRDLRASVVRSFGVVVPMVAIELERWSEVQTEWEDKLTSF